MRGNLKKRGLPAPVRSAVLAVLLVGSLLLLMLFCGWLFAGVSGAMISTGLGAIALMLVRKISPQFFLLLSGARSIDSEDMPALFGIIAALCPARRHCPDSEPLFPSIRRSDGLCHGGWRPDGHRGQLRAAAPSYDSRADWSACA